MHLAKFRNSHFQNCNLMLFFNLKNSQWQTNSIIKIPLCLMYPEFCVQYRCNHFFGTGLSNTSGNSHYFNVKSTPIETCQTLHGSYGIFHQNISSIYIKTLLGQCICSFF